MKPSTHLSAVTSVLAACVMLAACAGPERSGPTGTSPEEGGHLAGVHWRLQDVDGPDGVTRLPPTIRGWLEVDGHGNVSGSDGCATFRATSHVSAATMSVSNVTETANGCVSDRAPLDALRTAVDKVLLSGHSARMVLTAHRLRVSGGGYGLTYVQAGRSGHVSPTAQPATPATSATAG